MKNPAEKLKISWQVVARDSTKDKAAEVRLVRLQLLAAERDYLFIIDRY